MLNAHQKPWKKRESQDSEQDFADIVGFRFRISENR